LLEALETVRARRRSDLVAVLDGTNAQCFWADYPDAIATLERAADPAVTVRTVVPKLLRRRLAKAVRSADKVKIPTSLELHDIRIRFKHLRYCCEFFEPWFEKRVAPIIKIVTELQDTLGSLHECDVAPNVLQQLASSVSSERPITGVTSLELTRATLSLIQDTQRQRDELLVGFRDQVVELRDLAGDSKLKIG
jgi:CHAD domain-containing protein